VNRLFVDSTSFVGDPFPTSWEWEDIMAPYGAAPTAFAYDENSLTVQVTPAASVNLAPSVVVGNGDTGVVVMNTASTGSSSSSNTLSVQYSPGGCGAIEVSGSIPMGSSSISVGLSALNTTDFFASELVAALQQQQAITVNEVHIGRCPVLQNGVSEEVASFDTLLTLMNHTLQVSDNLYAELFLRHLGLANAGSTPVDTVASGVEAVQKVLSGSLGVNPDDFVQVDGSGLSRHNLVSPAGLVQLFEGMLNRSDAAVFKSLLPVGGESGSLANRFVGTPGQGKVHAKTGTMTGVDALSGYVDNVHFDALVFSIIVNTCQLHASSVRSGIDAVVNLLVELNPSC